MLLIMSNNEYGSVEYYEQMFSDILADIATGRQEEDDETSKKILSAFELSIQNWIDYHQQSVDTYKQLLLQYLQLKK